MIKLSENLKLRLDPVSGEMPQDKLPRPSDSTSSGDSAAIDDAESQMRKALGLLGESPRHRSDSERMDQPGRLGDRFNAGLHRRRFVQDGDIPVTVLRRDQGHEAPVHRGVASAAAPTSSRLQRTEAALTAETSARERAERILAETQSVMRDLQTKIGHAELAKNEAVEAFHRERDAVVQVRAENAALEARLQEALEQVQLVERNAQACQAQLTDERQMRHLAEKALQSSEVARAAAEALVQTLSRESLTPLQATTPTRRQVEALSRPGPGVEPEVVGITGRRRMRSIPVATSEPEPVKWWLNTKSSGKKR